MNRTAADEQKVVELRLPLASYPGLNAFALDLTEGSGGAARFLPRRDLTALHAAGAAHDPSLAGALIRSNARWGNDVEGEVREWQRGASLALVAGQQVCFAGGPLLVASKIASLLALRTLLGEAGKPTTVFFWLATEDHDFDEVASTTVQTRHGRVRLRARDTRTDPRQMVGDVPVPEELVAGLTEALSIDRPSWLREGVTFGDSFAELISEAFRGDGVILVDAMLPELREAGAPLLRRIAHGLSQANEILGRRSAELESAGYAPQIAPVRGAYSLLYEVGPGDVRQTVTDALDGEARRISTGAAARPLLQDAVLRPAVFVGGPSEVAYYAQVAALHDHYGIALPHVALRAHVLAAMKRTLEAIDRYGLEPRDLFDAPERVVSRLDPETAPRMRQAVTEAEERVVAELEVLRNLILQADPGMRRGLERRMRRVRYHFERLEQQAGLAAVRADADRYRAIARLLETLAPAGEPQDRKTAWYPMWHLFGRRFIDALIANARPDSNTMTVIGL
jgi:bacillithiol synthase